MQQCEEAIIKTVRCQLKNVTIGQKIQTVNRSKQKFNLPT